MIYRYILCDKKLSGRYPRRRSKGIWTCLSVSSILSFFIPLKRIDSANTLKIQAGKVVGLIARSETWLTNEIRKI